MTEIIESISDNCADRDGKGEALFFPILYPYNRDKKNAAAMANCVGRIEDEVCLWGYC